MWEMVKDILANVVFILFPLLFYLVFLHQKDDQKQIKFNMIFFSTLCLSLILTMSFPACKPGGFGYDLRMIPIILSFSYLGLLPGFSLVILMFLLTALIYPESLPVVTGYYLVASLLLTIFSRYYRRLSMRNKVLYISLFYAGIILWRFLYLLSTREYPEVYLSLILSFITWTTLISGIFLIENREHQLILQRELEQNEKMSALSQLAASIAHEIRNPMTTVRGFLQLLTHSNSLSEKDISFVKLSITELDRAQHIINDFLSFSKPKVDAWECIDLFPVINEVINILSSFAVLNNVQIDSRMDSPLYINGIKGEIQQVLVNLMKNAIEAMETGGIMEIMAYTKNNMVYVHIKDNGCGMSEEKLQRIGTAYYSTKEKGTGLGLMVSYEIVRRMNGKIHVESKLNVGTTFTLQFPEIKKN